MNWCKRFLNNPRFRPYVSSGDRAAFTESGSGPVVITSLRPSPKPAVNPGNGSTRRARRSIRRNRWSVAASFALQFAAVPVEPAETGVDLIEEVVVVARRREEPAQTVPIPITTISSTDLTMSSAFDARDLDRMVPNLSYGSSPVAKNTASVFLRGIGQTNWGPAQDPKVGTYVDGVYLARPQGGIFDLLDVERIEILRGPQGTLYGRNTTAGLVHVVTRQPTDEFAAELRLGAGQDGQSLMSGTMSVPLGDTLSTRIAVQQRRQDGFVTNRFDGTSWNDLNRTTARVITRWRPSETFEARLAFDGQRMRERPTLGSCSWVGPEDGAEANGLAGLAWLFGSFDALKENCRAQGYLVGYEDDPEANHDVDAHGVSLTIRRDIARIGTLTSITALRDTRERNGSWSTGGDSKAGGLIDVRQPTDRDNTFRQWTQEFRLEGTAESIDWVAGIFLFDEEGWSGSTFRCYATKSRPNAKTFRSSAFQPVPASPSATSRSACVDSAATPPPSVPAIAHTRFSPNSIST